MPTLRHPRRLLEAIAALLALAAVALVASPPAAASAVDLVFGLERIEGTFQSEETRDFDQVFVQSEFGGATSRLLIRLPYLKINHTGNVTQTNDGPIIIGAGGPASPAWQTSAAEDGESGIGDLYLRNENYLVHAGKGNRPALSMVVDLKWPLADEKKGLGTGEYDYGAGLDYLQPLGQHFQIVGAATYRFMGSPDGYEFQNRLKLSAGLAFLTAHSTWRLVGENIPPVLDNVILYNSAGAAVGLVAVEDYRIVRGEMVVRNGAGGSFRLYALTGLNDSSPDIGFGVVFASRSQ